MKLPSALTWGNLFRSSSDDLEVPVDTLTDVISIPRSAHITPWALMARRFAYAALLIVAVAILVYIDREAYSESLTFIDALYYSAVSLSTTGYGDITPVTQGARLVNIFVITPARVAFLMLLVGTTSVSYTHLRAHETLR